MKATIEASAGTGKTYELTTIVAAALGGGGLFAPGQRGSGLVDGPELAALESARPLRASEIVLVTYTEAATRELRGRVRGRLAALRRQLVDRGAPDAGADPSLDDESRTRAAARLGAALSDIDSLTVSTIHGFCDRLVQEHAFELGHAGGRRELLDEPALAEELAMRWWSARVRDDAERLERCRVGGLTRSLMTQLALEAISSRGVECAEVRGDGAGGDAVAALALDLMAFSRRAVAALCDSRGATTYQDMVLSVRDALRERPRFVEQLRSRHRLGVIDEAQDTDPVQLEIFERIFHGAEATDRLLVLVGDPKQAIYGFRGADLDAYLRLRGTESPRRLDTNWRSEPGAVAATNRLFSLPEPFGRPGIEHPRVHARNPPQHGVLQAPGSSDASRTRAPSTRPAPLEIHVGAPGETPLDWCATTLKDLHARGLSIRRAESVRPVRWSDFAVLGRSNAALGALDERLRAEGVPTLLLGDRSVLESSAAGEVAALLAACAEPGRGSLVRRAMVSSIVGIEASALAGEQGESLVREWSGRFDAWGRAAPRGGALAIVERALAARTSPADPRTAVDALHLAELLHAERLASAGVREWLAMLDRLVSQTESSPTRPGDPRRRRIERDDAVTLRTQHTAKGLEFGIVLLPWADGPLASSSWHRGTVRVARLPAAIIAAAGAGIAAQARVASDESVIVPVTKDGALAAPLAARDAEEGRRLFYVAVTRARHATLLFSAPRTRSGEPSAIEAYRVVERADGHEIRVVAPKERGTAAGASAGASAGAGAERAAEAVSATAALPVRPRRALSRSLRLWIDTSFTSLSRGAEPGEVERLAIPQAPGSRDDEPAPVVTRRDIAGGVILGRLMHRIFEWASNSGPGADLGEIVNAAIADSGDAGRLDAALVRSMTERTRSADLSACGGPRTSLDAIPASASAAELEFCLPMGHATSLSPARLAAALERAPPGSPASLFSPHAAHLGFGEITGFLRGVIDLLFEFDGRWWIVDYKTNDLGERDDDYRAASLTREMIEQRYVLQELLYAVAARRLLRRHGAARSREWLGGVIYPFVRGVDPREPGRGFFVDRPDDALLDALDEMLRAPGAEAAP